MTLPRLMVFLALIVGCKNTQPASTVLADGASGGACACSDLACWQKATNEGVRKQLTCLKDLGYAAMDVAGGSVVQIGSAIVQAADAFSDPSIRIALGIDPVPADDGASPASDPAPSPAPAPEPADPALGFELADDDFEAQDADASNAAPASPSDPASAPQGPSKELKSAATGAAKLTSATGKILKETVGACLGTSVSEVGNLASAFANATKIDVTSANGLASIVSLVGNSIDAIGNLAGALGACNTDALKGPQGEAAKVSLKKFTDAMKAAGNAVKVASAITKCTGGIVSGGKVLIGNTQCALDDLKALSAQTAAVSDLAQKSNQTSKEGERQYGANTCVRAIRDGALTEQIGLGVTRPLTDCSKCCSGKKFATPGYEDCSDKWKVCMQACAEAFGENNPRFFYTNSAVVDYNGAKCADSTTAAVPQVEKTRCCWTCRMPQRSNYTWKDCSDAWICGHEASPAAEGESIFDGSSSARDMCETKYDLQYHRMKVRTSDCGFKTRAECK